MTSKINLNKQGADTGQSGQTEFLQGSPGLGINPSCSGLWDHAGVQGRGPARVQSSKVFNPGFPIWCTAAPALAQCGTAGVGVQSRELSCSGVPQSTHGFSHSCPKGSHKPGYTPAGLALLTRWASLTPLASFPQCVHSQAGWLMQ